MKQIKIEIILESEKFEDSFLKTLKENPNPYFFNDFIQSFMWAFQITDEQKLVLRRLKIEEPEELEKLLPPLWIKEGIHEELSPKE